MDAIPLAKRRAVLADGKGEMSPLAVAIKHGVSTAWVRRLKQRRRETGEITTRPPRKKTPPRWMVFRHRSPPSPPRARELPPFPLGLPLELHAMLDQLHQALREAG
jgi:hypothetical protein